MDVNDSAYEEMLDSGALDNLLDHFLVFDKGDLVMILAPETVLDDEMLEDMMDGFDLDPSTRRVYAPISADYRCVMERQDELRSWLFNTDIPSYTH